MQTANLIHVAADGTASLVKRGDIAAVKKLFNETKLKKGEELELSGAGIEAKRRGGNRDSDAYFDTVAKENTAMIAAASHRAKHKATPEKPTPADIKKADEGKSEEALAVKRQQAEKHAEKQPAKKVSEK